MKGWSGQWDWLERVKTCYKQCSLRVQEGELSWGLVQCARRTREGRLMSHTFLNTWWDLVFVAGFLSVVGIV